jgi:hypothetical protein
MAESKEEKKITIKEREKELKERRKINRGR